MAMHPDKTLVATGQQTSLPGKVKGYVGGPKVYVWDTEDCTLKRQVMIQEIATKGRVCALAFSASGNRLACAMDDENKTVSVWNWDKKSKQKVSPRTTLTLTLTLTLTHRMSPHPNHLNVTEGGVQANEAGQYPLARLR